MVQTSRFITSLKFVEVHLQEKYSIASELVERHQKIRNDNEFGEIVSELTTFPVMLAIKYEFLKKSNFETLGLIFSEITRIF